MSIATAEPIAVRLRLIGPMGAWSVTGKDVLPRTPKARALLAVTALTSPRPAMRAWLSDLLWSDKPGYVARAFLRQELHRLQEALSPAGDILLTTRDQVSIRPGMVWLDAHEVRSATLARPTALALLDGELLEGLNDIDPAFDHWLTKMREHDRDRARDLAEVLMGARPSPADIIPAAWRLLRIDRTHEGGWRALMRAHAALGEAANALQAFAMCRQALAEHRDTVPSTETAALADRLRHEPPHATHEAPAANSGIGGQSHREKPGVGVSPMRELGMPPDRAVPPNGGLDTLFAAALARSAWLRVSGVEAGGASRGNHTGKRNDFQVDGSIIRGPRSLRVTMRLLDPRAGDRVIWVHHFARETTDLASVQHEIAGQAASMIEHELLMTEARRFTDDPADDASAYELMIRSLPRIRRLERDGFMQAGTWLARAIAREPDYPYTYIIFALWQVLLAGQGWSEDRAETTSRAVELVERAIELDPESTRAYSVAGHIRAKLGCAPREAIALHDRALTVNPDLPMAWGLSAITHVYLGEFDEAERRHGRYKATLPHDPLGFMYDASITAARLLRHDHLGAVASGRAVTQTNPHFSEGYKPYLAALGHLGQDEEAETVLGRLRRIEPEFSLERFLDRSPLHMPADRDHYVEGLRRAGVR